MLAASIYLSCAFIAPGRSPTSVQIRRAPSVVAEEAGAEVWTTKPSGLKITDLTVGSGTEAVDGSVVLVDFVGRLASDGSEFGSTFGTRPVEFGLGARKMIPGWEEGIRGMKVGGKRKMLIPPELAYGNEGGGPLIPPGATLEYETTLVNSAKLEGLDLIASKIPGGNTNLGLGAAIVLLGVLNFLGIIS